MNTIRIAFCLSLLISMPASACMTVEMESAQDSDASVLFEGTPTHYVVHAGPVSGVTSGGLAKVTFTVSKTLRGSPQETWTVLMRGNALPKNISEFRQRFGRTMTVGIRNFGARVDTKKLPAGFQIRYFIVDAACSMNGENWLLRPTAAKK